MTAVTLLSIMSVLWEFLFHIKITLDVGHDDDDYDDEDDNE